MIFPLRLRVMLLLENTVRRALAFILCLSFPPSHAAAAEPQWIWATKDAATKAEKGSAYFRKAFDLDEPESGTAEVTADSAFELFLNGRAIGTGDNAAKRYKFNLTPRLLPGRNVLAIAAVNDAPGPAGVAAKFTVKAKGKDGVTIVTDNTWKFNLRPQGTWTRIESDDSTWPAVFALGVYGQTAPWGKAGELVDGITGPAILNKPRSREKGLFDFRDGDRVVFLGSGFIERLQNTGYLETMLTAAMPSKNVTFRNLGWSGDTVWGDARAVFGSRADGFERLLSDVSLCNPTVLIVCYGENEAYAGEAGLKAFRDGLNTLLDSLEATGARIVLLGPRQHEKIPPPLPDPAKYNADLRKYNDVIGEVAKERELTFFDLYSINPSNGEVDSITENGSHLTAMGDWLLSQRLAKLLGAGDFTNDLVIDLATKSWDAAGIRVSNVVISNTRFQADIVNDRLVIPESPPIENISILPPNRVRVVGQDYFQLELRIDDVPMEFAHTGRRKAEFFPVYNRAVFDRLDKLCHAINDKNTLFFHRYRPQNETYLLLFRKHEQGNNAAEIPQFDPLIAELEKKIAELKKPVKQKYELVKVK